jgi:hypothetical protein
MPRTKKPAGTAVDARNGRRADPLALGPITVLELPRPREAYHPRALEAWDGFWSQGVAAAVTSADKMVAWTWIDAFDDSLRKQELADKNPIVEGSQGQPTANPLYAVAAQRLSVALQCARQLGIGGRNRADLGVALFGAAAAGAGDEIWPGPEEGDDDDDGDDDDPRLAADPRA